MNGQKPEVNFGPPIRKLDLVEATIRRAQLAILNPSVPLQDFVGYPLPEEGVDVPLPLGSTKQLAFSRNVIVLEISGPNVTDLTLVDLPGIIQSIGKGEDKNNIQLVENLVKDYIRKECLILLVITMKGTAISLTPPDNPANCADDPQNQKAVLLANDVDPQGKRTIGVLTKVDTLRGRDIDPWVKVLTDDASSSLHGYFVRIFRFIVCALLIDRSPVNQMLMSSPNRSASRKPERGKSHSSGTPNHGIPLR